VRPFAGRRIVLGVSGGIASYKSCTLARLLTLAGAEVDVVLTRGAMQFVGSVTFEALTARPVHTDIFAPGGALEHIRLAREAEAIVIAPATADLLARAAAGRADDLITAVLLANGDPRAGAPVLFVPAMNDRMWEHPLTGANAARLREIGYEVLDPDVGMLAAGEGSGPGRMPEPETIMAQVGRLLEPRGALAGRSVLVTAGPTREALDPVRYISNHSSGKMGVAVAAAAWRRGAHVTLVAGPMDVAPPHGVNVVSVECTAEMEGAVRAALPSADVLVMAAAPADFRAATVAAEKIKKHDGPPTLVLADAPDILRATRDARRDGAVIVGFALETEDALEGGRAKLAAKGLDMVVVNDAREEGAGFAVDTNRVSILYRDGRSEELPLMAKTALADILLDRVEALLG
jgi:phosphopantothenoylcysteine decarboxylase/phosphopantothenate--cysteine ligase